MRLATTAILMCAIGVACAPPTSHKAKDGGGGGSAGAGSGGAGGAGGEGGAGGVADAGAKESGISGADAPWEPLPGSGTDPGTCGAIVICSNKAGCTDDACIQKCADQDMASMEARALYNARRECVAMNCCPDDPMNCSPTCTCNYDMQCGGTKKDEGPPDPVKAKCAQTIADCFGVKFEEITCPVSSGC